MCESHNRGYPVLDLVEITKLSLILDIIVNLTDYYDLKRWDREIDTPGRVLVDLESMIRSNVQINLFENHELVLYTNSLNYQETLNDLLLGVMRDGFDTSNPIPILELVKLVTDTIKGEELLPDQRDLVIDTTKVYKRTTLIR